MEQTKTVSKNIEDKLEIKHLSLARGLLDLVLIGVGCQALICLANLLRFIFTAVADIPLSIHNNVLTLSGWLLDLDMTTRDFGMEAGQTLTPVNAKVYALTLLSLLFLLQIVPIFLSLLFGHQLLSNIYRSYTPFTSTAVRLLKRIGAAMILLGLVSRLLQQSLMCFIAFHSGFGFNFPQSFSFAWLLQGVIILALAEVFNRGRRLQTESDETL